jgi:hypothetical protein
MDWETKRITSGTLGERKAELRDYEEGLHQEYKKDKYDGFSITNELKALSMIM